MPAINFHRRFADAVVSGTKRQTIRPPRMRPVRVGDMLYLFTGMRTRACRRLGKAVCIGHADISISADGLVCVDGIELGPDELARLVRADGFGDDVEGFLGWFRSHYGLPWAGDIIKFSRWDELL